MQLLIQKSQFSANLTPARSCCSGISGHSAALLFEISFTRNVVVGLRYAEEVETEFFDSSRGREDLPMGFMWHMAL